MKKRVMLFALLVLAVLIAISVFSSNVHADGERYFTSSCYILDKQDCENYFTIADDGRSWNCGWGQVYGKQACHKAGAGSCEEVDVKYGKEYCESFYQGDGDEKRNCFFADNKCKAYQNAKCEIACKPKTYCSNCDINNTAEIPSVMKNKESSCIYADKCVNYYASVGEDNFVFECMPYIEPAKCPTRKGCTLAYSSCKLGFREFCLKKEPENTQQRCNDKTDNDCDRKIDCQDSDCEGVECKNNEGKDGFCFEKSCIIPDIHAELTVNEEYIKKIGVDRQEYLKKEKIPRKSKLGLDWNEQECKKDSDCRFITDASDNKLGDLECKGESYWRDGVCCWSKEVLRYSSGKRECFRRNAASNADDKIEYNKKYGREVLIVTSNDELECQASVLVYLDGNAVSLDKEIEVNFELAGKKEEKTCKPITSDIKVFTNNKIEVPYYCSHNFGSLNLERGSRHECKVSVKFGENNVGEESSNKVVVANYVYHFVKANQNYFGDIKKEYAYYLGNEKLSNVNDEDRYATKPVYYNSKIQAEKKDYIIEGHDEKGKGVCNINGLIDLLALGKVKEINPDMNLDFKKDRIIVVSREILDRYVQCEKAMSDYIKEFITGTAEDAFVLVAAPGALLIWLAGYDKPGEAVSETAGNLKRIVYYPISGMVDGAVWVGKKLTGGKAGSYIEIPVDKITQVLQWTEMYETRKGFSELNYWIIFLRGSGGRSELALSKFLGRSYGLCDESNLVMYGEDKKKLDECLNEFPACCQMEGSGELAKRLIASGKTLGTLISFYSAPGIGTVAELFFRIYGEPRDWAILGTCGSASSCAGYPLGYDKSKKDSNKDKPFSIEGDLRNSETYSNCGSACQRIIPFKSTSESV